jgi:tRNA (uracil-5-)-methyltransferase
MPLTQFDPDNYDALLAAKCERVMAGFADLQLPAPEIYPSPNREYRLRAEFRIWHEGEDLFYAMFNPGDPKTPLRVDDFPIASARIREAMPALREALLPNPVLRRKLFQAEFLSTLSGELLITLIYHRPLDTDWEAAARELERTLQSQVIGRSRKQRMVLSRDYVEETLKLGDEAFHYRQYEQGFTQPNGQVNCAMIQWACARAKGLGGDLLELYCGNGNFTLPLSRHFNSVLATEVAKSSIKAALHNCERNSVDNLALARLSAEEVSEALSGAREFRRLKALEKPLDEYCFSTVFVDPPRAGLDAATVKLVSGFENVLYISCNPQTLAANLYDLASSHDIVDFALFDQFPYTEHMECGAWLRRKN